MLYKASIRCCRSHGICVIGTYTSVLPDAAALAAVDALIQCGLDKV